MDAHAERNSPKEARSKAQMLLALLSHSEELQKGNPKMKISTVALGLFGFVIFKRMSTWRGSKGAITDAHRFVRICLN